MSPESSILIAAGRALPVAGTRVKLSTCSRDIRKEPLVRRKAELKKIIAGTDLQFSESFEMDGQAVFEHACGVGLEGVVSKVRESVYTTGRSNDRVKRTRSQRETLSILPKIAGEPLMDDFDHFWQ